MLSIMKKISSKIKRLAYYYHNKLLFKKLGKNSIIIKPMMIKKKKDIVLGDNVTIREMARIETIYKYSNRGGQLNSPSVIIESNCCIEQGLHLTAADCVHIHENVLIAPYVYITDCMHEYENINLPVIQQGLKIGKTEIDENTWIGIGAKIFAGVHIGRHCVIGANSVVINNIPDYSVAVGSPAKVIKRYNFDKQKWEHV